MGAFDEAVRAGLELLAGRAGTAIDNAKRFHEARQLAERPATPPLLLVAAPAGDEQREEGDDERRQCRDDDR